MSSVFVTTTCSSVTGGNPSSTRVTQRPSSIASWQRSVTRYVREEANGDPTVLRGVTLADARPGFAVIGHHDVRQSNDANGLLLGHERAAGRMWLVYLVGLVQQQRVMDVKLAAMSVDGAAYTWKRGKGSKPALAAYRAHGANQARHRYPQRKAPPPRYTGFPKPDDVFKLTNANGKYVATHKPSGARWELVLSTRSH